MTAVPPRLLSPALAARLGKREDQHKYDHGHAVVLAGGPGHGGAARLAARAALRIGAGLVTVCAPVAAMAENAAQLTSVMVRPVDDGAGLEALLADKRLNALCLGPGLGAGDGTRNLVRVALAARRACVLDADALTAFAETPDSLFALLHGACVLTPHDGEFARLFSRGSGALDPEGGRGGLDRRRTIVRQAAARAGCVVLSKGALTLIAAPDGHMVEIAATGRHAAPWLATAGSGDVLAGLITGLLARGFSPLQAAEAGAALHVLAARHVGAGLISEDLPEAVPAVLRSLGH